MVFTNLNSGYVFDAIVYECIKIYQNKMPHAQSESKKKKTTVYMMVEHVEKEAFKLMLDSDSVKLN